jgi:hypothetical protein
VPSEARFEANGVSENRDSERRPQGAVSKRRAECGERGGPMLPLDHERDRA